jgi:hypothetical protein
MRLVFLLIILLLLSGCVQVLTVGDVLERKDEFLNRKVLVSGKADASKPICTLRACMPENPCCNSCSGNLVLKDGGELLIRGSYNGKEIGCRGDECNLTCFPLERGRTYRVYGTLEEEDGKIYLIIESFDAI